MPAQSHYIPILKVTTGQDARQHQSTGRQPLVAGLNGSNEDAQVGVGIALIGRLSQRAGDEHLGLPVVVPGNVMDVHFGQRVLVTRRAQAKAEQGQGDQEPGSRLEFWP